MQKNDILVMITASRNKDELEYAVECSSNITSEEFEYYLEEIIKGICGWKPYICEESIRSRKGSKRRRNRSQTRVLKQKLG